MLQLIRSLLQQYIDDIDSGNSNITLEELFKLLDALGEINRKDLSKTEAANYIGVCRATFDNYVSKGLIPQGRKRQGFKELSWNKQDLDKFLNNNKHS